MTNAGLLRVLGRSLHLRKCLENSEVNAIEVNEDEMYKLDKLSLDKNKWRKRPFEIHLKIINDIKGPNGMNRIHDNKLNHLSNAIY